jgi:hypothetical protein
MVVIFIIGNIMLLQKEIIRKGHNSIKNKRIKERKPSANSKERERFLKYPLGNGGEPCDLMSNFRD